MRDQESVHAEEVAGREGAPVFAAALTLVSVSLVGFLLALIFQWPSDFVLGAEADSRVTPGEDLVAGTVTSIPLVPWLVLVVSALLVRSQRWWGTVAAVVLTLPGGLVIVGGLGEVTSQNAHVPKAVLVVAGATYALLGLALLISGALALFSRVRRRG